MTLRENLGLSQRLLILGILTTLALMAGGGYLLRDRLRYQTAHPELFLEYGQMQADQIEAFATHINPPQYALEHIQYDLIQAHRQHEISDITYTHLSAHLNTLGMIQAGCDRIASTPVPFAYSVLLHRAIHSFCIMLPFGLEAALGLWTPLMVAWLVYMFLGLDMLSAQLEDPFGRQDNNLPLDSLVRLVEREILTALNVAQVPPALQPHNGHLT